MKGIIMALGILSLTANTFAQRVKRKGTTPIEMNPNAPVKKGDEKHLQFTLAQIQGKWQEHGRSESDTHHKLTYSDTLMLNIKNNQAELREGKSMNMKGDVAIENGDDLEIAGDSYVIRSISNGWMVLDDGEFLRALQQVDKFYLETVGKDSINQAIYKTPQPILLANVTGKWLVYRREAKPGAVTNDTELVKSILVAGPKDSANVSAGEIVVYQNDISEKLNCVITIKETNMLITAGKRSWTFDTFLADKNEFVFGKAGELIHYAKKL